MKTKKIALGTLGLLFSALAVISPVCAASLFLTIPDGGAGNPVIGKIGFQDASGVSAFCLRLDFQSGALLSTTVPGAFSRNATYFPSHPIGTLLDQEEANFIQEVSPGKIYLVGLFPSSKTGRADIGKLIYGISSTAVESDSQIVTLSGQIYTDQGEVLELIPVSTTFTVTSFIDEDHDGMDDGWEIQYFGSLERDGTGDFDNDGICDQDEYRSGTDPKVNDNILAEIGDIDGNGILDLDDAVLCLQILNGITPGSPLFRNADVDGDGKIGMEEAVFILQRLAGSRE